MAAPKAADAPDLAAPTTDSTNAALSAGGQFASGNSKLFAATGLGKFDMRRGNNAYGVQVVGNYAEGAVAPSTTLKSTTENLQGKLRYDRYFTPAFGAFMQLTGTHDAFQAITFRLNVDPGVSCSSSTSRPPSSGASSVTTSSSIRTTSTASASSRRAPAGPALETRPSPALPYVIPRPRTRSTRIPPPLRGLHRSTRSTTR